MRTCTRIVAVLALLLTAISSAAAQKKPATEKKTEWTLEDILLAESARQFRISPDGRWAVWVKVQMDKERGARVSNLFLSSLVEKKEIQLTRGSYTHFGPRWSPDGALLSFLSTRPLPETVKKPDLSKSQLWLMNPTGGEPWHLTEFERGIRAYAWKDKETILFAAQEDPTQYEQSAKEKKDTSQVIEDTPHEPPVRLFALNVKDKKVTRLTDNQDWIDLLSVSPDGKWAVTRHQRSLSYEFDHRVPPVSFLTNLESGQSQQLFSAEKRFYPVEVEWGRDSQGFYFSAQYSSHPQYLTASIVLLYYFDLASSQHRKVDLDWERGLAFGGDLKALSDGVLALLVDGVRFKPARFTKSGESWSRAWVEGEHASNLFIWELGEDNRSLVYLYTQASQPEQWYGARLEGARIVEPAQLTDLNPGYKGKPLYRSEIVHWKGARGDDVEGILYYPLSYEEGKRFPLILTIHGGPAGADMDAWDQSWAYPKILLSQKSAFLLETNYHGSSSYGLAWVESICCGNYYDLERVDLENGVDYVIGRGLADPDKLATMGWSNGSILTTELITRSRRYKAASAGAGDVEWISDWGNVDFGASFDNYYFGAAPYENPELYIRKSPYFRLKDVTTPTIIYTGTEDRNVPPSQSWSHYRVMQQATETPVKFIVFPGEPHGLQKFVHQKRKAEEDLAWFDRYLFGTYKTPNEAFKEGSPLDVALKRTRIQRVGTRYGVDAKGTLVPEVVKHKGLELGRFEVTRAQFAAFDRNYRVEPGTENFPANGISFEQAQAYVAWLAKLSGQTFRLAKEEEVKDLYESARGNENTLDYWAGYAPNPEDAARLVEKARELPGAAPLLREAGLFQGRGEDELVFDLGGNVAEWVVGADGKGKLLGGSADRAADPKARALDAAEVYRGFRLLRGGGKEAGSKAGASSP